jgi:autotransporter-associated beta strand protein
VVSLAPAAGQTLTIGDVIADQTGSTHQTSGTSADGTPLSGAGSLLIDGAGTVVLNAANTYTGGTILNGGTLEIDANGTAGAGAISFASKAGTLRIDGAALSNPISGFIQGGDVIDLPGLPYVSGGSATLNPRTQMVTVPRAPPMRRRRSPGPPRTRRSPPSATGVAAHW